MKKLLYIFTFALLVIACDKYEDQFEVAPTAIELEEVDATVDSEARNAVLDILFGGIAENAPVVKGNSNSASKGNDYIAAYILVKDGITYMVLVDDSNDDFCFGETSVSAAYINNAGNGNAQLEDENEAVTKDLGNGYASLFTEVINEIIQLDFTVGNDLIVASAQFNSDNVATFN